MALESRMGSNKGFEEGTESRGLQQVNTRVTVHMLLSKDMSW